MILRIIVAVGLTAFCILEGLAAATQPTSSGHYYFPGVYILIPLLLLAGLGPRGLITWPIATIFLLLNGHVYLGWLPLLLVVYNLIGNEVVRRRGRTAQSRQSAV